MKLQIALSNTEIWMRPTRKDLELEYEYEYVNPSRNWKQRCHAIEAVFPIFSSLEDFIRKVNESPIERLTAVTRVHNMTDYRTIEDIEDLVSGYHFPRDVKRIVEGFAALDKMPLPIIIKGRKGRWILSGNTRQNVALVMEVPRKAIVVDAQ